MTDPEPWTIKRLLDWTGDYFSKSGSDAPRLEAEILLAEAMGCARIELYTRFNETPDAQPLSEFRAWVKRRAAGEPVAYLVGHREFYSLKFKVNSDVLIPRPETEHLVVAAIDAASKMKPPVRILDVGTGSGCVAITLKTQIAEAEVTASDVSAPAIEIATSNAEAHGVSIEFVQSDLFSQLPDRKFDLIVSNPPYIGRSEQGTVASDVEQYEPHLALYAGADGTEIISRLVQAAPGHLSADGVLMFETSPLIMDRCVELVCQQGAFDQPQIIKDYSGHPRILVANCLA